ncbi:glycosyltransferase [Hymenobacter sp.]|uniref:glycosyltransferase n=1 Tax=Hymenobacter sp. TaxID=1898978 RepID=UPI00286CBC1D|nr:glycosyltransferase [Hymenobacter sp.]
MSYPVVSIGIGSYNNAAYLETLLDSVQAQTYPAIELIVVDDCSTDHSALLVQRWMERTNYPVTFLQHERNQGLVRTFSDCTRLATGSFVSLVGSDDVLDPELIARTVAEFNRRGPSCGAVYADCRLIDSQGKEIAPSFLCYFNSGAAKSPPEGNIILPLLRGFYLPTLTTTVRREALAAVGPHDETLFSEDLDMWLRISRKFQFAYLPAVLGSYRVHDRSAVHTNKLALNETYFRIYRKGYFEGDAEWKAARHNLAEHAEHYYASQGPEAPARLWFALHETRRPKVALFWLMARLGVKYSTLRRLMSR